MEKNYVDDLSVEEKTGVVVYSVTQAFGRRRWESRSSFDT